MDLHFDNNLNHQKELENKQDKETTAAPKPVEKKEEVKEKSPVQKQDSGLKLLRSPTEILIEKETLEPEVFRKETPESRIFL